MAEFVALHQHQSVLNYVDEGEGQVWYESPWANPDNGDDAPTRVYLPAQIVGDMGRPDQITVTVRPGNWLTEDEGKSDEIAVIDQPTDQQIVDLLGMVSTDATLEQVAGWTDAQKQLAVFWATCEHLEASDNEVPDHHPKPDFL